VFEEGRRLGLTAKKLRLSILKQEEEDKDVLKDPYVNKLLWR